MKGLISSKVLCSWNELLINAGDIKPYNTTVLTPETDLFRVCINKLINCFQRFAALAVFIAVSVITQCLFHDHMSCGHCHAIPYDYRIITTVSAVNSSVCSIWKIIYNIFIQELGEGNPEETYICSL